MCAVNTTSTLPRELPLVGRSAELEALLALCFLVPTRLPRAGQARSGLARVATPAGEALHAKLAALPAVNKLDPTHLLMKTRQTTQLAAPPTLTEKTQVTDITEDMGT